MDRLADFIIVIYHNIDNNDDDDDDEVENYIKKWLWTSSKSIIEKKCKSYFGGQKLINKIRKK